MISLGARYVDYGLTGGFFLFLGAALFVWIDKESALAVVDALQDFLSKEQSEGYLTLLSGILASLFVVCVFAAGLLLDLIGSILIIREADVFRVYVVRNKGWLEPLLARYQDYLGDDVGRFLAYPNYWAPKSWYDFKSSPLWHPRRYVGQMARIESILLAHLLLTADRTKIEFVLDQVRTCRMARAITSGSLLMLILFVSGLYLMVMTPWGISADSAVSVALLDKFLFLSIAYSIATVLFVLIVRRAYAKLCNSLFSSICVLSKMEKAIEPSGSK